MNIQILYGKEGADLAVGTTVVVDVFRAATVASYAFQSGAEYIIPVADQVEAFALREEHPEYILMGEHRGVKIEGFDFGNSPFDISQADLTGKVVVQRTGSGTQGLVRATGASTIFFGGFPTLSATAQKVRECGIETVSIIAMEGEGAEDDIYAKSLRAVLLGEIPKWDEVAEQLHGLLNAQRFFRPEIISSPREDFDLCSGVDTLPFAVKLLHKAGNLQLIRV